ncbi:hypothetical protein VCHA49P379_210056 [Vibrio chagasii]|nr:hypothetical protein VCHA49P379_210056 [Vibrio chagasii]
MISSRKKYTKHKIRNTDTKSVIKEIITIELSFPSYFIKNFVSDSPDLKLIMFKSIPDVAYKSVTNPNISSDAKLLIRNINSKFVSIKNAVAE